MSSGFVVWLTGALGRRESPRSPGSSRDGARVRGLLVDRLDGDVVRERLTKGLGFSKEDRDENIARIGWVASRLARAGAVVVVSAISPYEEARQHARELTEEYAPFVLVHVATSIEECERRDPKGLYGKAHAGEIRELHRRRRSLRGAVEPGASADTEGRTPEESAPLVIAKLEELGLVREERGMSTIVDR